MNHIYVIHTYTHTLTDLHSLKYAYIHTSTYIIKVYIHTYIHTYIHSYIHTYVHTFIYIQYNTYIPYTNRY